MNDNMIPSCISDWFSRRSPAFLAQVIADPSSAAIFSTDMIVAFCDHGSLASERVCGIVQPVAALFRSAHRRGLRQFVLLQDTHHPEAPEFQAWPAHAIRGTEESETIPELKELPFADRFTFIEKNSLNPAIDTLFESWLGEHPHISTAIVVGNCTDLCVYQLAMYLRIRANALNIPKYRVVVPENAVQTYDSPEHPGDFFHQVFLYHMAVNGIEVVREFVETGVER